MKAVAIVGMVFVHIYEITDFAYEIDEGPAFWLGVIVEFMGGVISAGVFMFAMGWGIAFSDRATPKTQCNRSIQLFLLGLFVNIVCQWVPMIALNGISGLKDNWYGIFAVSIYQFAALAMLFFALIKWLGKTQQILISLIALAAAMLLNTIILPEKFSTGNNAADTVIGLFVRENEYSFFPFVTWIAFPILGFAAGSLYRKINCRKSFVIRMLCLGTAIILISTALMKKFDIINAAFYPYWTEDKEYYAMNSLSVLCACGMIAIEFVISAGVIKLNKEMLPTLITTMSKNVMSIYVIQWIFIISAGVWLVRINNAVIYVAVSAMVLAASYVCSIIFTNFLKNRRKT